MIGRLVDVAQPYVGLARFCFHLISRITCSLYGTQRLSVLDAERSIDGLSIFKPSRDRHPATAHADVASTDADDAT